MDYKAAIEAVDNALSICGQGKDDIKRILAALCEQPQERPAFKVGDFVRVIKDTDRLHAGLVGTVKAYSPHHKGYSYAVEFPAFRGGHDCDGNAVIGHGYWCRAEWLEEIE